ncbi:hypothetical protein ACH5RR_015213 [Cinchona calisaya]|uniref:MULE transposase domain-containing protein n=1 Tax=Cinchona calisaya TaxID=153742 RepID=A0ABD2ZTA8_9GENT
MIEYSCARTIYHGLASSSFLCEKYKKDIQMIPNRKVSDFQTKVHNDLNVNITRNQAYLTKRMAKELIEGDSTERYKSLHYYVAELLRSSPGSNIFLTTQTSEDGDEVFKRFYVCLQACKEGFLAGCRPIVGLDGCHLRGPHKGILLSTVGIDPNNQLYSVAYAMVEIEDKRTWRWFVEELIVDLHTRDQAHWTFITDKQKSLIQELFDLLLGVEHRLCQLKEFDSATYKWLVENTNPKHWSRSHFRTTPKCDILLNNLCESFNSAILEAKEKPILGLETIRHYLMVRIEEKREWMKKIQRDNMSLNTKKKIEQLKEDSKACIPSHFGEWKYEIRCMYGDQYTVDLDLQSTGHNSRKCPDKPTLDPEQAAGKDEASENPTNHSTDVENQTNIGATGDTTTTGQAATDDATHAIAGEVHYSATDSGDSWLEDLLFSDVINIGSHQGVGNTNTKIPTQPDNTALRYKCSLCHEYCHNRSSCGVSAADLHASYQARSITRDAPATYQPAAMISKKSVGVRSSKSGVAASATLSMSAKHFVQHPDAQDDLLRYAKDRTKAHYVLVVFGDMLSWFLYIIGLQMALISDQDLSSKFL